MSESFLQDVMMNKIIKEDINNIIDTDYIDWERFRNKTVLVTGANGMLPSYMAMTLLELNRQKDLNIRIVLLVRNFEKASKVFGDYLNDSNLEFVVQDISEPLKYQGAADFIIHAASQASPSYYATDPVGTAGANLAGTDSLLRLATHNVCEGFLYFSTGGVYGKLAADISPITEETVGTMNQMSVNSCYFLSKKMAENLCVIYHKQYGVPTKIVRIFHTIGPEMNLNDGRAFSDFCKSIIEHKDIILKSDGSAHRTFCYATDAVKGYFKVLLDGNSGEAYNVGSSLNDVSILELANGLCSMYPERGLSVRIEINDKNKTLTALSNQRKKGIPSTAKLQKLGWSEETDYKTAFARVIASKENIELN